MRKERFGTALTPKSFDDLISNDALDPDGLLAPDKLPKSAPTVSAMEKINDKIREIADFIKTNRRLPEKGAKDRSERSLAVRLEAVKTKDPVSYERCISLAQGKDEGIASQLKGMGAPLGSTDPIDEEKVYESVDDILDDDPLGLLDDVTDAIPSEQHAQWKGTKQSPGKGSSLDSEIAQARECPDFYRYKRFFDEIAKNIKNGNLKYENILGSSGSIFMGDIFVIKGVTSLIADCKETDANYKESDKLYRKKRIRIHQILDNGKESWPTAEAVRASFYKKNDIAPALRVVPASVQGHEYLEQLKKNLQDLSEGNWARVVSGYVYILRSKSSDRALSKYVDNAELVKIGCTTTSVEERIAHAEQETTYLCAGVEVAYTFSCTGVDPEKLEHAVHAFLHERRLNVTLKDRQGHEYHPKEWFTVSADTAYEVVNHIRKGDIGQYRIDPVRGLLREKTGGRPAS